jgi:hypothetical protein
MNKRISLAALIICCSLIGSIAYGASDRFSDRSTSIDARVSSRGMCSDEMFCKILVYQAAATSTRGSRLETVSCNSAFGVPRFNTPSGFLESGDYYFQSSDNTYVERLGASVMASSTMTATGTSSVIACVGPHTVTSTTKPVGMNEVQTVGNAYFQSCDLHGSIIAIPISAAAYAALATASGIPSLQVDPRSTPLTCI